MGDSVDLAAMDAFLAEPRNAIVGGVRRDGRPHMTPNWFLWDGDRFFVSTTKSRLKYRMFSVNPAAQLMIDDPTGFRYVMVDCSVEIGDDVDTGLPYFQALRAKHGRTDQTEAELREEMIRDDRVLLMFTPDRPQARWHARGF